MKRVALCPGSFDPVTNGHLDIIKRAAMLFDEIIVLVSINKSKTAIFTAEERCELVKECITDLDNVTVKTLDGLLADYVQTSGAVAIIKGLRAMSDFEFEFQQALANKKLNQNAETIFLSTNSENMFVSSSLVKQIAHFGGDITDFVPKQILNKLLERLSSNGKD